MKKNIHYATYKNYMVKYNEETYTLTMRNTATGSTANLTLDGLYDEGKRALGIEEYTSCRVNDILGLDDRKMVLSFDTDKDTAKCEIFFTVTTRGIKMVVDGIDYYTLRMTGDISHGSDGGFFAVDTKNISPDILRADAKPENCGGNAVYSRETDSAFAIENFEDIRMTYCPEEKKYNLVLNTTNNVGHIDEAYFSVKKDLLKQFDTLPDKNYAVKYDEEAFTLTVVHQKSASEANITFDGLYENGVRVFGMEDYSICRADNEENVCTVFFGADGNAPDFSVRSEITAHGVELEIGKTAPYTLRAVGDITHGEAKDSFAINTKDTSTEAIRAAIGPAASVYDNAVYNRQTDSAFSVDVCADFMLSYDWSKEKYGFELKLNNELEAEKILFSVKTDILKNKFDIEFKPLKKRGRYDAPPSGWMTWYSVFFDAGEKTVLENTRFQEEHLKKFGADTIWVDWEWCHQKYETDRFDGVDNFHPDLKKYPHGLGYVAEKIKEAGFVPAIWIGFTNDVGFTEYEKEHPEISLSHHPTWSGRYYYDISHPEYLNGYLTKAVQQVKDWGYETVKYDTLPNCISAHENHHANMYNPELTTYEAFMGMINKTREILGEDFYMLACGITRGAGGVWHAGVFDAVRIGPDLHTWENFVATIERIRMFYPLHNIAIINDPDTIVLREKFSTYEQAVSRTSIVSLLGMPLTFGDDLPKLSDERLDLIKRALPVMKVHPTDFNNAVCDGKTQVVSLGIELPFERYLVAGVINLTDREVTRDISIRETLRLPEGEYLVYDYFGKKFLGSCKGGLTLKINAFDTKVLCLRKKSGKPQLVSTSRHITQGAAEIRNMHWNDADAELCVTSELVAEDAYTLTVYIPKGYAFKECSQGECSVEGNILTVTVMPQESRDYEIKILFSEN